MTKNRADIAGQDLPPFLPPFWMRPSMVQTLIASMKFRKKGTSPLQECAIPMILNCGEDTEGHTVRLKGSYSHNPQNKALFIFLHGWEGSQDSTYVVSSARRVYDQGASVFRLNFRDHGGTHYLNENIFLATRFDEVLNAVAQAVELAGGVKTYLVGFSLGGNFALRVARTQKIKKLNLSHIFAISPVIDPWDAAPLVDKNYFIQRYFKKKLHTSYGLKQDIFPDVHDFSLALSRKTIMEASADILLKHSGHDTLESYFSAYGIKSDDLEDCETPTSLIMAQDDPVVPAVHLDRLKLSAACQDIRLSHGGHNGFFQTLHGPTWYDDYIQRVTDL